METGTQTAEFVGTKQAGNEGNRDKVIKFRVNAREDYLLNQVDKNLGFGNVSTTLRWLVEHYTDIEKARLLVEWFRKRQEAEVEIEKILAVG